MARKHALKLAPSTLQQSDRHAHIPAPRCYSTRQIIGFLGISRRTFFNWKKFRSLPWLIALNTPDGCAARYKAEPVDRFLEARRASESGTRSFFGGQRHERQSAAAAR